MENWIGAIQKISKEIGLSDDELNLALQRIASSVNAWQVTPARFSSQVYAGIEKNVSDNPMLAAWVLKIASRVAQPVFEKFRDNFLLGTVFSRKKTVEELQRTIGYHPPVTLVINPTMRCDLRCRGCYAYSYARDSDMDRDLFRKVIRQARELGMSFLTLTGGEPFLYPDLEDIFREFPEMIFMVYTNGQHIDAQRASRLSKLGNVWPALSVEGFEQETDKRRGAGVYQQVIAAMEHLRNAGVLFGISVVPTRLNSETIASDEFLDHYIEKGALIGWMFTYLPVGREPDPDLMQTPKQRDMLRQQSIHWRKTKPFFMADFFNDGPLCGGCMSANFFAFVTNQGWVQPCTFVHFATHNIRDSSLLEIFDSPLFRSIRECQPYDKNLLRPCKIIDHPEVLREIIERTKARPIYPEAESIIKDPRICTHLDKFSKEYAGFAETAWNSKDYESGRSVLVPFFGRVDVHQIYNWRFKNLYQKNKKADNRQLSSSPKKPEKKTSVEN